MQISISGAGVTLTEDLSACIASGTCQTSYDVSPGSYTLSVQAALTNPVDNSSAPFCTGSAQITVEEGIDAEANLVCRVLEEFDKAPFIASADYGGAALFLYSPVTGEISEVSSSAEGPTLLMKTKPRPTAEPASAPSAWSMWTGWKATR